MSFKSNYEMTVVYIGSLHNVGMVYRDTMSKGLFLMRPVLLKNRNINNDLEFYLISF